MAVKTVLEGVRDAIHDEMKRDPRVFIMGEDVGPRGNVFLITKGFLDEFGRDRVIDTPLAEASIVGVAIGAAMAGMRPIAEIQFADFIFPAYNQIVGEAARIALPQQRRLHVPARHPRALRRRRARRVVALCEHRGVLLPRPRAQDLRSFDAGGREGMLTSAIRDDDPVLFLEHKRTYRLIKGEVPGGDFTVPIGKADIARAGKDLSVITYGLIGTSPSKPPTRSPARASTPRSSTCVRSGRWTGRRSCRA